MRLVVLLLLLDTVTYALKVIGGNATVVQAGTAVLLCRIVGTEESVIQITWQRQTREKKQRENFYTISEKGPQPVNGDQRFTFIGNFNDGDGTLQLANVKLKDEGTYICIVRLFSTSQEVQIPLTVLVPPVTTLKDYHPHEGTEEVALVSCTAAGSKPPAKLQWVTGALEGKVRSQNNSTIHANDTSTTYSRLFGIPIKEINNQTVQCVVTSDALEKQETHPIKIQIHFPPVTPNISEISVNTFQCSSDANPAGNITWVRFDGSLPQSGVSVEGVTLRFLTTSSSLSGAYSCEASNKYGKNQALLYVKFSSGSCTAAWVLFSLLMILNAALALYFFYTKFVSGRSSARETQNIQRESLPLNVSPSRVPQMEESDSEETVRIRSSPSSPGRI